MAKIDRLARNFHQSFKPERQYLNALIRYAAAGKSGTYQEIALETGIPMGASSGKVPSTIDYCRGMGLVVLSDMGARSAIRKPILTDFGRMVLLEDPFLKLSASQWIAHLNLCSPYSGAEVWYQTFFEGCQGLGMTFTRSQLEEYLCGVLNTIKKGNIGPMIGTYEDDASLKECGVLAEAEGVITRRAAPTDEEFTRGYGAWLLQLIEDYFPKSGQISVVELNNRAGCRLLPGWDVGFFQKQLSLVEVKGYISIDRHMDPWLIQPKMSAEMAWKLIFDDII